jgi:hypothetical protein
MELLKVNLWFSGLFQNFLGKSRLNTENTDRLAALPNGKIGYSNLDWKWGNSHRLA